jgi:hypothetical protein
MVDHPFQHRIHLNRLSQKPAPPLFAKEFYGSPVEYPYLRRYRLPDGRRVEVLGINSVRLRGDSDKAFGYVQWPLYDDLLRNVPHDPEILRIAVLHHHLVAAPREEALDLAAPEASISITLDAGAVIEGLQTHGFSLVLHGHQHVPKATRVARAFSTNGNIDLGPVGSGIVVLRPAVLARKDYRMRCGIILTMCCHSKRADSSRRRGASIRRMRLCLCSEFS